MDGIIPYIKLQQGGGGGGSDKVFIATYGTSTASEVASAITAGKIVVCKYTRSSVDIHWLYLVDETDGKYVFAEASVTTNDGVTAVSGISAALNKSTSTWEVVTGSATIPTGGSDLDLSIVNGQLCVTYEEA